MLRSNLAVLLAERNLKITKVAADTGISRTTLTSLYYNNGKGVQFDTIDILCEYLGITPGDLIVYYPLRVNTKSIEYPDNKDFCVLTFEIEAKNVVKSEYPIKAVYTIKDADADEAMIDLSLSLLRPDETAIEDIQERNQSLIKLFKELPIAFFKDTEMRLDVLFPHIIRERDVIRRPGYCFTTIHWPKELEK